MSIREVTAAAARTIRQLAGERVVYRRPTDQPPIQWPNVELTALIVDQQIQAEETEGPLVVWRGQDFLIAAADLILAGQTTTPQPGDQIVDQDGRVFEVMAPSGYPVWRPVDPHEEEIRIHAKLVDERQVE